MRSVVVLTGDSLQELAKSLRGVRAADPAVEVALVGPPSTLQGISDDVIRVSMPEESASTQDARWFGLQWAIGEAYDSIIALTPTDPVDAVPAVLKALNEADAVVGSRFLAHRPVLWPMSQVVSRFGSLYAQVLLRLPVRDATTGLMGFRRHVLEAIHLPQLRFNAELLNVELKVRAHKLGFTLAEIPIDGRRSCGLPGRGEVVGAARRVLQLAVRGR